MMRRFSAAATTRAAVVAYAPTRHASETFQSGSKSAMPPPPSEQMDIKNSSFKDKTHYKDTFEDKEKLKDAQDGKSEEEREGGQAPKVGKDGKVTTSK